jgi:hypothetical protein
LEGLSDDWSAENNALRHMGEHGLTIVALHGFQ